MKSKIKFFLKRYPTLFPLSLVLTSLFAIFQNATCVQKTSMLYSNVSYSVVTNGFSPGLYYPAVNWACPYGGSTGFPNTKCLMDTFAPGILNSNVSYNVGVTPGGAGIFYPPYTSLPSNAPAGATLPCPFGGTNVTVSGNNICAVASYNNGALRKVHVLLYRFTNSPTIPNYTPHDAYNVVFGQTGAGSPYTMTQWLAQASYGKLLFKGATSANGASDIWPRNPAAWDQKSSAGFYQTAVTRVNCSDSGKYQTASQDALQQAIAQGLVVDTDDIIITGTIPDGCPGGGSTSRDTLRSMISMSTLDPGIFSNVVHEVGHASALVAPVMLAHSGYLKCDDPSGTLFTGYGSSLSFSNCQHVEYGGYFSALGGWSPIGGGTGRLFDGENRLEAGFLPASSIQQITQSGTYKITKLNSPSASFLRIPIHIKNLYAQTVSDISIGIEARDFESWEQGNETGPGTNVLILKSGSSNPARLGTDLIGPANQAVSNVLETGKTVPFSRLGISITNLGPLNATDLNVKVDFNQSLYGNLVNDEPVIPKTPRITSAAGATASFTWIVGAGAVTYNTIIQDADALPTAWKLLGSNISSNTYTTPAVLQTCKEYQFSIQSVSNTGKTSPFTQPIKFWSYCSTTPTNLQATFTPTGGNTGVLSWNAVPGAAGYNLQWGYFVYSPTVVTGLSGTTYSITVPGNLKSTFSVQSYDSAGNKSPYSIPFVFNHPNIPPPTNVTVSQITLDSASVTWSTGTTSPLSWVIQYQAIHSATPHSINFIYNGGPAALTGLSQCTTYNLQVKLWQPEDGYGSFFSTPVTLVHLTR